MNRANISSNINGHDCFPRLSHIHKQDLMHVTSAASYNRAILCASEVHENMACPCVDLCSIHAEENKLFVNTCSHVSLIVIDEQRRDDFFRMVFLRPGEDPVIRVEQFHFSIGKRHDQYISEVAP